MPLLCLPALLFAQDVELTSVARQHVAAQATNELSVWSPVAGEGVDALFVALDTVRNVGGRFTLVRGLLTNETHAHPYLLALAGDTVLDLGGFAAPMLAEFSRRLAQPITNPALARERAKLLALAADENGAAELIPVSEGRERQERRTVVEAWERRAPIGWPRDTVAAMPGGAYRVTLTVLSKLTWAGHGPVWIPIAYCFTLTSDGHLSAWAKRQGPALGARE